MTDKKSSSDGDARTPDKRIGEVAYADGSKETKLPSKAEENSQREGPAAYAPHEDEPVIANRDPKKGEKS